MKKAKSIKLRAMGFAIKSADAVMTPTNILVGVYFFVNNKRKNLRGEKDLVNIFVVLLEVADKSIMCKG